MKRIFNARIMGHELFAPDKDKPKELAVRLKLAASSMSPGTGKPTKAIFAIEKQDLEGFPIGSFLRIEIEDSQQELPLAAERTARARKGAPQLDLVPGAGVATADGGGEDAPPPPVAGRTTRPQRAPTKH